MNSSTVVGPELAFVALVVIVGQDEPLQSNSTSTNGRAGPIQCIRAMLRVRWDADESPRGRINSTWYAVRSHQASNQQEIRDLYGLQDSGAGTTRKEVYSLDLGQEGIMMSFRLASTGDEL